MKTQADPSALPTDLDSLAETFGLDTRGHGDTREAYAALGGRLLRVWWDDMGPDDEGWSWETRDEDGDHESSGLDSSSELRGLLEWLSDSPEMVCLRCGGTDFQLYDDFSECGHCGLPYGEEPATE